MLGEESNLGASFSYNRLAKDKGEGTQTFNIMQNNVQKESSTVDYLSPGQSTTYSANAYYVGKIGGLNVDFNTDYYWYGKKQWMDLYETVLDEYRQTETEKSDVCSYRNNRNYLLASKLVLSIPLLNGTFSLGGEYSHVNRRSHYQVEPEVVDNEKEKVKESMTSAFVDYSHSFGQLTMQAGLRYEYINFDYYDNDLYIAEQSKTYGNWFPSLALSLPVGKTQMQLTYATDIYRPSYNELRSGVQYDNQYTYESGNPFLVPSITHNLTYGLSWEWLNLQLVYSHISDEVCTMTQTYRGDPMKSLARPENINSYNSFQAGLTLNPTFGIWHPTLETMLFKQWLKMNTHVGNKLDNPVAVFQLTNAFDFKLLTASFVMTAQTEGNMGNKCIRQGYFNTDLSLYKSLLKNRLTLTLDVSDVFGTGNQHRTFYSGVQRTMLYDLNSTSTITFSIRYRFNATNSKYKGTGAGQSQKNRM
ncbi:outer membrane beta-barrel family protein [Segatella albensis]|nr:outer membrane beta-barrel family protein [Segatella albensis]